MSAAGENGELPEGWARIALEDIGILFCGQSPSVTEVNESGEGTLYVTGPEQWDGFSIRQGKWTTNPKRTVPDGCIFITVKGAGVGKLFPGIACAIGRDVYAFKPTTIIDRAFVQFALADTINEIKRQAAGDIPGLSKAHILDHSIGLPPLAEQKRIAKKVEGLLARVNAARDRLARVPAILKRFRQSVLAAACSGRLTEDWRDGPLSGADDRRATTILDETTLITSGSRGWAKYYADDGPLFIRAQNINTDRLRLDGVAHVDPPRSAEGSRTRVQKYDILITITGANVTKSALVEENVGEAYVSQHVALVRPREPESAPFLFLWIVSPAHGRSKLEEDAYGAGKPGLNLTNIREVEIQLPALAEQHEIVRRVDALFALADAIEARLAVARGRTDKLTQSILNRAFRGQLVPTEAELARREGRDYETAEQLLERIRATSSAKPSKIANKKRQKKAATQ